MAGNAVIGALRVNLGIDSAQFSAGLKSSQASLAKFGKTVAVGFAAVATAAAAAGAAMGLAVKGAIDSADALSKAAQKVGTTTEALSRLKYAADYSDVSLEQLTGGLGRLSKSMLEVASGSKGPAATALKALGISVTDASGKLRDSDQVFADIAERFGRMEDGATKTALAIQLFGKAGAELIPLLNSGKDGLAAMAAESDRLGLTISTSTGKAAEKFNDTLTKIGSILGGVVNKVMEAALPALQSLADTLSSPQFAEAAATLATTLVSAFDAVVQAVVATTNAVQGFLDWMRGLGGPTPGNGTPLLNGLMPGEKLNLADSIRAASARANSQYPIPGSSLYSGFNMGADGNIDVQKPKSEKPFSPTIPNAAIEAAAEKSRKAYAAIILDSQQYVDQQQLEAQAVGMTQEAASRLRHEQELLAKAASEHLILTPQQTEQLKTLAGQMAMTEEATRQLTEAYDFGKSTFGSFFSDLKSQVMDGASLWTGFADAASNALSKIADKVLSLAADGIFDMLFGAVKGSLFGGGGFLGTGGGAATLTNVGSFAGGGYTGMGSRTGGIDGMGGFPAILHPNETVVDHAAGQSAGAKVVVNNYGSPESVRSETRPDGTIELFVNEAVRRVEGNMAKGKYRPFGVSPSTRRT